MKIYTPPEPPYLIRLNIKRQGEKTEFINLSDTNHSEVSEFIKSIVEKQNISPFAKGNVTNVEMREAKGAINGKSISLSFRGMEPKAVLELIILELSKPNKYEPSPENILDKKDR